MATEIVTAKAGTNHVDSEDIGALYAGGFGPGRYALAIGENLKCTMKDANTLVIGTGGLMFDGRFVRVKNAEELTVTNGTQGQWRKDLAVLTYERDTSNNNIETVSWEVVRGTPAASESAAKAPSIETGSILDGDEKARVAVAEVDLNGLSPTCKLLLSSVRQLTETNKLLDQTRESVSQKVGVTYGVEDDDANLDNCTATGQYSLFNAKKAPIADWMNIYVMRFADNPNYVSQLAVSVTGAVYVRTRVRGTWNDWSKL